MKKKSDSERTSIEHQPYIQNIFPFFPGEINSTENNMPLGKVVCQFLIQAVVHIYLNFCSIALE